MAKKGLYYNISHFNRSKTVWLSGYLIFILTVGTGFLGYILPWGQMSFWAATVIINMTSIIPFFGEWLTTILWGGYSVNNCTLQRFFVLHFLMPFVILALAFLHISVIHSINSTSNFNVRSAKQSRTVKLPDILLIDLYPLLIIKDIVMVSFTILISFLFLVVSVSEVLVLSVSLVLSSFYQNFENIVNEILKDGMYRIFEV